MFLGFMAGLLVLSVPLTGGRLSRIAAIRLRHAWLVAIALGLQVVFISIWTTAPSPVERTMQVFTYVLAALFLWLNRRVAGLAVVAAGTALNGLVITINGGELPASRSALLRAGQHEAPGKWANSGVLAHPHLAFLGDVAATPSWLPLRNVISIGDVLILVGAAICIHSACGTWPARAMSGLRTRLRSRRADLRLVESR